MVQPVVNGIQSKGIIANAKHWVENNQETDRDTVSENVDERTRHEIYYPPFQGAVEAKVGSFMCAYNKVNNRWSCENEEILKHDLKENMGFSGWVMSDWGATHSTSIREGLDQEM
jgi:beta-glucosidase